MERHTEAVGTVIKLIVGQLIKTGSSYIYAETIHEISYIILTAQKW